MTPIRVLFIGFDPATMNLDGAPAGTAAQIQNGIDDSMIQLKNSGFDAVYCSIDEGDDRAEQVVRGTLQDRHYDCVVIGAGVRLLSKHTVLFEALVNAVIELAPTTRLAFNATPADAAEAVQRQVQG